MTQLAAAVDADERVWELDSLPVTGYVKVDDEIVRVTARFESSVYSLTGEVTPPRIRVDRGMNGTSAASHSEATELEPLYIPGSASGGETIYRSEHITFDMAGLVTAVDDVNEPPEAGIRLGDYVVPAGSLVWAVPITTVAWEHSFQAFGFIWPLIRDVDGLTSSTLIDGALQLRTKNQGFGAVNNVETPMIVTEESHLGIGLTMLPFGDVATGLVLTFAMDDSQVTLEPNYGGMVGSLPPAPFVVQIDSEKITVISHNESGNSWDIERGAEGTTPAVHDIGDPITILGDFSDLDELSAGEAYIVFAIAPLSGDLP